MYTLITDWSLTAAELWLYTFSSDWSSSTWRGTAWLKELHLKRDCLTEGAPPEEGLPDWSSSTWRGTAWLKELHLKRDCLTEGAPPEEGLPDWSSSTWRGTAWLKELHLKRDCLTEAAPPEEGLPDWSSSTWRETDYLTEGASSAPANGCSLLLSLLPQPPCSRCLVPGMFKLSCSTHFTHFLRLVSVYRLFHLYFIPKTLTTMPVFSAPFLQLISVNRPFHLYFIPKTHHDASVFSSLPAADFCQPALRPVFHSKNSPRCLCFQLPSCNWFLSNQPFSCICLD